MAHCSIGEKIMGTVLFPIRKTENNSDLFGMLKSLDAECRVCTPTSPLDCITRCKVYRIKNELRYIRETMDNPDYIKEILNVLKNETRLHILQAIDKGRYSVSQLQKELKKNGYIHSQDKINIEYLRPLMSVGLATESIGGYYATTFGGRLTKLLVCFPEFVEKLPTHSECYDESILQFLLSGPKTYEDIGEVIPPKIVSRVIKRIVTAGLGEPPVEKAFIFFFRSKRDPNKETFTETERKIYDTIPSEGISAGKLARETAISMRRIYKCLRGLKGKKLVFVRRTPKVYSLTCEGEKLASVLQKLQQIVEDTRISSEQVMQNTALTLRAGGLSDHAFLQ